MQLQLSFGSHVVFWQLCCPKWEIPALMVIVGTVSFRVGYFVIVHKQ